MRKPVVGVMGASANDALTESEKKRLTDCATRLGVALVAHNCVLVTGATTGIPDLIARAFRAHGGFALGVSPALNHEEHLERGLSDDGADVIIYTGFGYKERNVINVRSADVVVIRDSSCSFPIHLTTALSVLRRTHCWNPCPAGKRGHAPELPLRLSDNLLLRQILLPRRLDDTAS